MEIEKIIRTAKGVRITWTEDRDDLGVNTPEQIRELAAVQARDGRGCLEVNVGWLELKATEPLNDNDLLIPPDQPGDKNVFRHLSPGYPSDHFKDRHVKGE